MNSRWTVVAALLLAMSAAVPVYADDGYDCANFVNVAKTDPGKAAAACRRLADRGDPIPQIFLGFMYAGGSGVPQDYVQAYMWISLAAAKGNLPNMSPPDFAATSLAIVAAKMTSSQIEQAKALAAAWKPTTH